MKMFGIVSWAYSQGVPKIFRAPICRAHCAAIFAIAQLSCIRMFMMRFVIVFLNEYE